MSFEAENSSNFDKSCEFFEKNYTQNELYDFLKSGSDMEKQLACLRIDTVNTSQEAEIFMSNLTGVDGKIREAVSFKLKGFMASSDTAKLFNNKKFWDIFLDAIIDINGNICRNIICAISNLVQDEQFSDYFRTSIITRAFVVLENIDKFTYKDKKYVTNKELFKLYWYLETLYIFGFTDYDKLFELLKRCSKVEEYTIREKAAALVNKLPPNKRKILNINSDNNIYVAKALARKREAFAVEGFNG